MFSRLRSNPMGAVIICYPLCFSMQNGARGSPPGSLCPLLKWGGFKLVVFLRLPLSGGVDAVYLLEGPPLLDVVANVKDARTPHQVVEVSHFAWTYRPPQEPLHSLKQVALRVELLRD